MGGAVGAGIMGVSTKLFSVTKAFDTFVNGMAELISVPFILVCAWSLVPSSKAWAPASS